MMWYWSIPLLLCGWLVVAAVQADEDKTPPYGYGMGPGMMGGGGGMGPGMMGGGGMGPGMMGGYGMGPGMMGGYGMGPGMMGGYGMGPGMMGGYGMGPGMMGGGDMGPGMMGGGGMMGGMGMMGPIWALDLNDNQRRAVENIMNEQHTQHWSMMTSQFGNYGKLRELYGAEMLDAAAIGKVYDEIFRNQRAMIESGIKTRNRIYDQLTKEQKEQLKRWRWSGRWGR
jgi:Spy/CpxP family protein refolding chaperone